MQEWKDVDVETFQKLTNIVNDKDSKLIEYVYTHRVCKVSNLMEKFSGRFSTEEELLSTIGHINGKIFKRYNCAIFPKQPAHTIKDSAYSLGVITEK